MAKDDTQKFIDLHQKTMDTMMNGPTLMCDLCNRPIISTGFAHVDQWQRSNRAHIECAKQHNTIVEQYKIEMEKRNAEENK